jgi:5-methylcytosine-specific restriction endonuclease McrA
VDFKNAHYQHNYPKSAASSYIRKLSDLYSQQNATNYNETRSYATEYTQGKCFYCGKDLYTVKNDTAYFTSEVQYDHILPASLGSLYAKGNVVLSCSSCNNEKNNMSVEEYYELRLSRHDATLYSSMEEFYKALAVFQIPYRRDFPEFMGITLCAQKDPDLISFSKVNDLLMDGIDLPDTLSSNLPPAFSKSPNVSMWSALRDPESSYYQDFAQYPTLDAVYRINGLFQSFADAYSVTQDITTLSTNELTKWANSLLVPVAEVSMSECSKMRSALKALFIATNNDFSGVYTYTQARDDGKQVDKETSQSVSITKPQLFIPGTFGYFKPKSPIYKSRDWATTTVYKYSGPITSLRKRYEESKMTEETDISNVKIDTLDISVLYDIIEELKQEDTSVDHKVRRACDFFISETNKYFNDNEGAEIFIDNADDDETA